MASKKLNKTTKNKKKPSKSSKSSWTDLFGESFSFPNDVSLLKLVTWLLGIVFNVLIIAYLVQLDALDCECTDSHEWMPSFIKASMMLGIMVVPFVLFLRTRLDLLQKLWDNGTLKILGVVLFVIGVTKTYALFNYSLHLYNCKCADDWRRSLMLWEGIFGIMIYFFYFLLLIYAIYKYIRK